MYEEMPADDKDPTAIIKGIGGAIAGGVAGYFATTWLASQGLYAIVLPGALLGLGCGYASRIHSGLLCVICIIGGLFAGLLTEALNFPFIADESLGYFFRNLGDLKNSSKVLILIGAAMGGWFGRGR